MKRPKCEVSGCNRGAHNTGSKLVDGTIRWRKSKGRYTCAKHHHNKIAKKHGLKNFVHVLAKNAGFDTPNEYLNSIHPYRKYRKEYCENKDARLGFPCTSTIVWKGMLAVDHIDENHDNNNEKNHQTFCHNCHAYKTNLITKLYAHDKRDETVWKKLKYMLRLSGKDTVNRNILKRWKEKYA